MDGDPRKRHRPPREGHSSSDEIPEKVVLHDTTVPDELAQTPKPLSSRMAVEEPSSSQPVHDEPLDRAQQKTSQNHTTQKTQQHNTQKSQQHSTQQHIETQQHNTQQHTIQQPQSNNNNISYASAVNAVASTPIDTFVGKLTITAMIKDFTNFQITTMLADMKKAHLNAYRQLRGAAIRNRNTIELLLANEQSKQVLITYGLDTQGRHLNFNPDVPEATAITLYNIPMEMPDEMVDKIISRYGKIVTRYRHKQKVDDLILYTGRRIYRVELHSFMPKQISINGHSVRTLYTGQREEIEKRRETSKEKEKEKESRDRTLMEEIEEKSFVLMTNDDEEVFSFLHPKTPRKVENEEEGRILRRHEIIKDAEKKKKLKIKVMPEERRDSWEDDVETHIEKARRLDHYDLMALTTTKNLHLLPMKDRCRGDYNIDELLATMYYLQYGIADRLRIFELDDDLFPKTAVERWNNNDSFTKEEHNEFIRNFTSLFQDVYICYPAEV